MVVSVRRIDRDAARLLFFRHDAFQIDMEQAVLKARGLDLDMLGKLEAALEGAAGDALVQERRACRFVSVFALAGDGQHAVLDVHRQVLLGKAGDRQGDAVVVLVVAFDIVGRIALLGRGFQKTDQPVKADGGAEKGGIVDTHGNNLLRSVADPAGPIPRGTGTGPITAAGQPLSGMKNDAFKPFPGA